MTPGFALFTSQVCQWRSKAIPLLTSRSGIQRKSKELALESGLGKGEESNLLIERC